MELYVRNKQKQVIGIIDAYNSVIWSKRYNSVGDFEIYTLVTPEIMELLKYDYYITRLDDDMVGIIEHIIISSDEEEGAYITISGRSAESILSRRIVWNQTNLNESVESGIRRLIDENVINPTIPERKIPDFILGNIQGFTDKIEKQITGDNLLDAISKICNTYELGFRVTLDNIGQFKFSLYRGEDRSYGQQINPYVVFSPTFDNLLNSEYESDLTNYKNVALVAGEGEGAERKTKSVGTSEGMDRRELFVDARDLSSSIDGNTQLSDEEYNAVLKDRGSESLSETNSTEAFSGETEPKTTYTYKADYFIGDIVQIENEYGITAAPRIVEIMESDDDTGYRIVPGFTTMEV